MQKKTKARLDELIDKNLITRYEDLTAGEKTNIIFDYIIKKPCECFVFRKAWDLFYKNYITELLASRPDGLALVRQHLYFLPNPAQCSYLYLSIY